jgi:hypothetical protein
MTAVSFSVTRGSLDMNPLAQITVGTAAPTASFDIEFRFNTTDQTQRTLPTRILWWRWRRSSVPSCRTVRLSM